MPYRTTRRKRPAYVAKRKRVYRKKRIIRKRQNNPSKLTFHPKKSLGVAFPERYLTKVKGTLLLSSAATNGFIDYQVRGNSILDFGSGLSSDNVSGFSVLQTLYNKALVYGSKIIVQYANSTTTPKHLVLYPTGDVVLPTSTRSMMDQPYAKSKLISANTGQGKTTLSQYVSSKRILGLKDIKDVEDCWNPISSSGSQPVRFWNWNFRIDNATGAGTDSDIVKIMVIYYVECFERATVNQS